MHPRTSHTRVGCTSPHLPPFLQNPVSFHKHFLGLKSPLLTTSSLLPPSTLCRAALVCRTWRRLATDPVLWKSYVIRVRDSTFPLLFTILATPRLQRVNRLDLRLDTVMPLDSDMRLIRDRHFEVMEANWTNFSLVNHSLLAQTIAQLKQTDVLHYNPDVLFPIMAKGSSRLEYLQLVDTELAGVPPAVFAEAVAGVRVLELLNIVGQAPHIAALLCSLAGGRSKVRRLVASGTDMGEVEVGAGVLARALHSLQAAAVDQLSPRQMEELLTHPVAQSRLQEVEFNLCDFSSVPALLFSRRLSLLTRLDLQFSTTVTVAQVTSLLSTKSSTLTDLVLSNSIDLSSIEEAFLASRICQFQRVEMNGKNKLTKKQILEIFRVLDTKATMKSKETKDAKDANNNQFPTHETKEKKDTKETKEPKAPVLLMTLGLWGLDLSPVAPDTIGRVVNRLWWANLSHSSLTCCQLRSILSPTSTSLQVLSLKGTDASLYPKYFLSEAEERIGCFAYREDQCGHSFPLGRHRQDFSDTRLHDFLGNHSHS